MKGIIVSSVVLVGLAGCVGQVRRQAVGTAVVRERRGGQTARALRRRFVRRITAVESALAKAPKGSCGRRSLLVRLGWLHLLSGLDRNKSAPLFLAVGGHSFLAHLGLALMAETADRPRDAAREYGALLRTLLSTKSGCSGDQGLIRAGRCSLARFAVRRLGFLLDLVPAVFKPSVLSSLAAKLPCGWASWRLALLARDAAMRLGRPRFLHRVEATMRCPRHWGLSVATGLGALDVYESRRQAFGQSRTATSPGCVLDLTHPDGLAGLARAESRFTLARPGKVRIWVSGGGGPFRLSVDGRRLLSPGRSWQWPKVVQSVCLDLRAGAHSLVLDVPVGAGRIHPAVWMTDPEQRPVEGVTFGRGRSGDVIGRGFERCASEPWPGTLHMDSDLHPLALLLDATDRDLVGERDAAETLAGHLSEGYFAEGLWLTAGRRFLPAGLTPDEVRERLLTRLRHALDVAPGSTMLMRRILDVKVALGKAEGLLGAKRPRSARQSTWWSLAAKVRVFLDRYWTELARKTLRSLLRMGKDRPNLWRLAWDVGWQSGDRDLERRAALRLHELDATDDHWARFLLDSGKGKRAVDEYRRLLNLGAFPRRDAEGLARALLAAERPREAAPLLHRVLSGERWNVSLWMDLVNVFLKLGRRDHAVHLLRDALAVRPDSREVRRALVAASGGLGIERLRRDARRAIQMYERTRLARGFEPGPLFVIDDMVDWVLPGGGVVELVHQLIHFRPGTDLGLWGQIPIPAGAEVLRLRVIKKDGRILVPERTDNGPVNLPGIEVGDYAEFEFLRGYRPVGALTGGFAGPRFFFATTRAATMGSRYQVVVPAGMKLQVDRRGRAPRGIRSRLGDRLLVTWTGPAMDRVHLEDHAPPQSLWLPSVRVAANVSWARLAAASRRRFLAADRPSAGMRALVQRFCGGGHPRLGQLYDWVQDHIEQAGSLSDRASAVLARRRGYRLNLMRALLRLCGAHVATVMIRPTHRAGPDGPVKDLRPYGYAALELRQGGRVFYLFPYLKEIPFGFLPAMLRGAQAVRVQGPDVGPFVTPKGAGRDRVRISLAIRVDALGRAHARVVERLEGWPAITLRRGLDRSNRRRFEQVFQRERLGTVFPGATGRNLRISVDRARRDLVTMSYEVWSPGIAHIQGDTMTLRRSFFALHLARRYLQGKMKRTLPIQVGAFPDFELKVSLSGPKGWKIVSSIGDVSVNSVWGAVRRRRSWKDRVLRYQIDRHIPFHRVPAGSMKALARFLRRADAAETLVVSFSRRRRAGEAGTGH